MTEGIEIWKPTINTIIAALPVLGTSLFVWSAHAKHKLEPIQWVAFFLVVDGFFLFAFWQNFLSPTKQSHPCLWYSGWIVPVVVALIYTAVSYCLLRKGYKDP